MNKFNIGDRVLVNNTDVPKSGYINYVYSSSNLSGLSKAYYYEVIYDESKVLDFVKEFSITLDIQRHRDVILKEILN